MRWSGAEGCPLVAQFNTMRVELVVVHRSNEVSAILILSTDSCIWQEAWRTLLRPKQHWENYLGIQLADGEFMLGSKCDEQAKWSIPTNWSVSSTNHHKFCNSLLNKLNHIEFALNQPDNLFPCSFINEQHEYNVTSPRHYIEKWNMNRFASDSCLCLTNRMRFPCVFRPDGRFTQVCRSCLPKYARLRAVCSESSVPCHFGCSIKTEMTKPTVPFGYFWVGS